MLIYRFFLGSILPIKAFEIKTFFILWACYYLDWFRRRFILWDFDWMNTWKSNLIVPFYFEILIKCFYNFFFICKYRKCSSPDLLRIGKYFSRLILLIIGDLCQNIIIFIIGFILTNQYKCLTFVLLEKCLYFLKVEMILELDTLIF